MLASPILKFLHSMRERRFLEQALKDGLLLTDHKVRFNSTENAVEFQASIEDVAPLLAERLAELGTTWDDLSAERQQVIRLGLGSIQGQIPMLCFTEVPEGRDLAAHHVLFGAYGLVVRRQWLESHGGDRVLYVGNNSPISRNIHRVIASLQTTNLVRSRQGELVFRTSAYKPVLDLFAHVQQRSNLEEFEWRIAGRHGFVGGGRDRDRRIAVPIDDIESELVQNADDITPFTTLVSELGAAQGSASLPLVLCQPATL